MIVIEGNNGKTIKVEEILKTKSNEKILLVDNVNSPSLYKYCTDMMYFNSNDEMWEKFVDDDEFDKLINEIKSNEYDLVIFETNDDYALIDNYGAIEDRIDKTVIVTLQNDNLSEVKVYECL